MQDGESTLYDMTLPDSKKVLINEVFTHGSNALTDPDWVELKNPSAQMVDLAGYSVRDDKTTYRLPAGLAIAPGGYLVLFADDITDGGAPDRVHLPFKLGNPDALFLLDPAGTLIDSTLWDNLIPGGKSWGRLPDGTGQFLAINPSPGSRNL
jgi:hypothetical protein